MGKSPLKRLLTVLLKATAIGAQVQPPPAPGNYTVHAGRLFDSTTGRMLTRQVVLISGERIAEVGAEGSVRIPAGYAAIDLGTATVLPGPIDAHTHMFDTRGPKTATEAAMLIAVSNAQADLRAAHHHGARHEHARQRVWRYRDRQRH